MPIIMKTSKTAEQTKDDRWVDTLFGMADATAKAIGAEYKMETITENDRRYFIPMESLGYPGLGIFFESNLGESSSSDNTISCGIYDTLSDGISPDTSKESLKITSSRVGGAITNTLSYCPETCVIIYDDAKDTVLFDIHPGVTLNGTDLNKFSDNSSKRARTSFTLFFAKDVNGGVLCGVGNGHINSLRTLTSKMPSEEKPTVLPQMDYTDSNVLHLTKMINYLDPSFPEMKSAYISVIRPIETDRIKRYISTLYAGGKRWARAGLLDSWPSAFNTDAYPPAPAFFPIEPFVNY